MKLIASECVTCFLVLRKYINRFISSQARYRMTTAVFLFRLPSKFLITIIILSLLTIFVFLFSVSLFSSILINFLEPLQVQVSLHKTMNRFCNQMTGISKLSLHSHTVYYASIRLSIPLKVLI